MSFINEQKNNWTPPLFGTQLDIYKPGYEWINHSITPLALDHLNPDDLRIDVGERIVHNPTHYPF